MTLDDILADPATRARFVTQGVALIEEEVGRKRGLSGMAIKTGFKTVRAVRPGVIGAVLDMLLPHFAPAVAPHFEAAKASGDVAGHFAQHADAIADAMLAVTDARAERAENPVLKRTYRGLRGQAKTHTVEAMPGVGRLLAGFVANG